MKGVLLNTIFFQQERALYILFVKLRFTSISEMVVLVQYLGRRDHRT
jgi:hypothetical protein